MRTLLQALKTLLPNSLKNQKLAISSRHAVTLLLLLLLGSLPTAEATSLTQAALDQYNLATIASLIIVTVNVRGRFRDFSDRVEIKKFLDKHSPHILVLQETWTTKKTFKSFPPIIKTFPGYTMTFIDAIETPANKGRPTGGQIILIEKNSKRMLPSLNSTKAE